MLCTCINMACVTSDMSHTSGDGDIGHAHRRTRTGPSDWTPPRQKPDGGKGAVRG